MNTKYIEAFTKFKVAFTRMVRNINDKLNDMTIKTEPFASANLTLKNNTVHRCVLTNGVTELTLHYPEGDFISTVLFSTAKSGKIKINFPKDKTYFVGTEKLEFFPRENWELNIHN